MPKLYGENAPARKPEWLKIRLHRSDTFAEVARIVREHSLHTICSSGRCPNKAECWSKRTATFMILGDVCTRGCRFCATKTGKPLPPNPVEPQQVAESVKLMGLRYVVVVSVVNPGCCKLCWQRGPMVLRTTSRPWSVLHPLFAPKRPIAPRWLRCAI